MATKDQAHRVKTLKSKSMNIFKNGLKIAIAISLIFLLSCEKDQNDSTDNTLTQEIGKIETIYQEGAIKIENKIVSGIKKVETYADENYKEGIRQELEKSISKQTTYLKSGSGWVGVLKNGACGSYQELSIFMDCEDGNWNTSGSGWIGNNSIDANGNVTLVCCVVSQYNFIRCQVDYAVLDISGNPLPSGVNGFTRYIDNEDKNNKNKVTLNGTQISGAYGNNYFNANTTLAFQFYPKNSTTGTHCFNYQMGYLGIYLHDFGLFGKPQSTTYPSDIRSLGSITSDDEDSGNANWLSQTINVPNTTCTTNIMEDGHSFTTFNFLWMHFD
ncbi:MAG: hypothetical protein Q8R96_01760 [Bacteroidota bacterium]|nr:hypothetical protein [Bacteroidota bacterium]